MRATRDVRAKALPRRLPAERLRKLAGELRLQRAQRPRRDRRPRPRARAGAAAAARPARRPCSSSTAANGSSSAAQHSGELLDAAGGCSPRKQSVRCSDSAASRRAPARRGRARRGPSARARRGPPREARRRRTAAAWRSRDGASSSPSSRRRSRCSAAITLRSRTSARVPALGCAADQPAPVRCGDRDPDQADGLLGRAAVGSRDAGDADADVGAKPLARAVRQRARRPPAETAPWPSISSRRHRRELLLDLVRVGDDAAAQVGRGPGTVGQACEQQPAGAGLGDGDVQALLRRSSAAT